MSGAEVEAVDGAEEVLRVKGLVKTFRVGFLRKRVEAVRGVDFEVRRGEIFGLLGPNGAGKTTTIKMLLGLIFPNAGKMWLFGEEGRSRARSARIGYLPESPYVYQYLKPLEFLDLCGRLVGLAGAERRRRAEALIGRVGLEHAVDRPIGKFSKGMMQRIGLAQALLHEPELLVLDEPMSGLDPIGRREVRDLLLEERRKGRTLLFTSHILSDVERLCDRVCILEQGKVRHAGHLDELLRAGERVEIELRDVDEATRRDLEPLAAEVRDAPDRLTFIVEGRPEPLLERALAGGAAVLSVVPSREALEDLFLRSEDPRESGETGPS